MAIDKEVVQVRPTTEDAIRAQAHVIGLLNEVQAVMEGWVLGYAREDVEKPIHRLYEMLDTDEPPAVKRAKAKAT